jgi:hypothetical protein
MKKEPPMNSIALKRWAQRKKYFSAKYNTSKDDTGYPFSFAT